SIASGCEQTVLAWHGTAARIPIRRSAVPRWSLSRRTCTALASAAGLVAGSLGLWAGLGATAHAAGSVPTPDHTVVVVFENHAYNQVIGSSSAPYINSLKTG